jgi:hypothetical protein
VIAKQQAELERLQASLKTASEANCGRIGYWAWQGSEDFLESLTCPILISANDMRDIQRNIERLQAIVDKLPKTADGVAIIPTMQQVYGGEQRVTKRRVYYSMLDHWMTLPTCEDATKDEQTFPVPVSECYSTREAAENYQEKEK